MKSNAKFLILILPFIIFIEINITNSAKLNLSATKFSLGLSLELKASTSSTSLLKSKLTTKYCNPMCKECSQNDLNFCTICQAYTVFYQYGCYDKCPEGTFRDESLQCQACHVDCPMCWGAESNMCGTEKGVRTQVVTLEQEIKNFLLTYTFTRKEIDEWIGALKVVLERGSDDDLLKDLSSDSFSTTDIYELPKADVDLPLGSYSKLNGVFIPVPTYLNIKKELVNSHWVFKKGMWDGQRWVQQHYPRPPRFIRDKGQKNKLYYENGGFWIWDAYRGWFWLVSQKNKFEQPASVHDSLSMLNGIKIDLGDYARRKWRERMEGKKISIENNVRDFFDKFLNADGLIFNEMKHTMFEEQNNLINSLDDLKSEVHTYFGEESEVKILPHDEIRKMKAMKQGKKTTPHISKPHIHIETFSENPHIITPKIDFKPKLEGATESYHKELTKKLFDKINSSFNVK